MGMNYDAVDDHGRKGWIVEETRFSPSAQGKCEAIMCIGNGYLGARAATEESYVGQVRNTFIAGTFNRFHESEVTELPNVPDVLAIDIRVGGHRLSLAEGRIESYRRRLNLASGEVQRNIDWVSPGGDRLRLSFRRFASMHDRHLLCSQLSITALTDGVKLRVSSGIDGRQTNSGAQHFTEGEGRIHDRRILEYVTSTTQSEIDLVVQASHRWLLDGRAMDVAPAPRIERRQVFLDAAFSLDGGQEFILEKQARFHCSLDQEQRSPLGELRRSALERAQTDAVLLYARQLQRSESVWNRLWREIDVSIQGNGFDQLAVRFAMYHMLVFTPAHDARVGIAAKGLSGEGYKGHSFWDSEIFILPFFIFSQPDRARRLLEYRYNTLSGARANAQRRGYRGAMFAWESAESGEEVTPEWGAVDIHTGLPTKVWSGLIEQHITADVAFAVWNYYRTTADDAFMASVGYEILFSTATFWCSRLEWLNERGLWGLRDVVGPDEYKEHVNNNAFTNHMAEFNIRLAIEFYEALLARGDETLRRLGTTLDLDGDYALWKERVDAIYLPQPRALDQVLPQDDSYLSKDQIDLTPYRTQAHVGTLFDDYSLDEVNELQISKQADVIALFWLLPHRFSDDALRASWAYYEPRTLHDSSLSPSAHVCVASRIGDAALAYDMFERAARIDLGPAMNSSNQGIHAAAMGGLWQAVVCGFGGLRVEGDKLHVAPMLPAQWDGLSYAFYWRGQRLRVDVSKAGTSVTRESGDLPVELFVDGDATFLPGRGAARG